MRQLTTPRANTSVAPLDTKGMGQLTAPQSKVWHHWVLHTWGRQRSPVFSRQPLKQGSLSYFAERLSTPTRAVVLQNCSVAKRIEVKAELLVAADGRNKRHQD